MRYKFEAAALEEFDDAVSFLESARTGAGSRFARAVMEALFALCELPRSAPVLPDVQRDVEMRRKLVRSFDHWIIYAVTAEEVVVFAIAHTSREPNYWQDRLRPIAKR